MRRRYLGQPVVGGSGSFTRRRCCSLKTCRLRWCAGSTPAPFSGSSPRFAESIGRRSQQSWTGKATGPRLYARRASGRFHSGLHGFWSCFSSLRTRQHDPSDTRQNCIAAAMGRQTQITSPDPPAPSCTHLNSPPDTRPATPPHHPESSPQTAPDQPKRYLPPHRYCGTRANYKAAECQRATTTEQPTLYAAALHLCGGRSRQSHYPMRWSHAQAQSIRSCSRRTRSPWTSDTRSS